MKPVDRFNVIFKYFEDQYEGSTEKFSQLTGIPESNVRNWLKRQGKGEIQTKNRNKILDAFELDSSIWDDYINTERHLMENMDTYKDRFIENQEQDVQQFIFTEPTPTLYPFEEETIQELSQQTTISLDKLELEQYSPQFLYELSKLLKNKKQPQDAIDTLERLEQTNNTFVYKNYSQIELLKAICYSDDHIRNWGKAIRILSILASNKYYRTNLEVLTLLASNYKRKALTAANAEWCSIEVVDTNLLLNSIRLYKAALNLRKESKYYEAINILYLAKIAAAKESIWNLDDDEAIGFDDIIDILEIFKPDRTNWWEVSSKAEYHMLIDQTDKALVLFTDFLDVEAPEVFELETTLRQINLYKHFTNDPLIAPILELILQYKESL